MSPRKRRGGRPRKPPEEKLVSISGALPKTLIEAIDRIAFREDRSRSSVMRDVLERGFATIKPRAGESSPTL